MIWVSWTARSYEPYGTNPRSKVAHATEARAEDVRVGGFPLACGRWAPDGWDADVVVSSKQRCARCVKALAKKEEV